jgi:uncharacterized protein YxjI
MKLPDKIIIQQKVDELEIFTGLHAKNRYRILTESGKSLLFAYEESSTLTRLVLSHARPFVLHVIDQDKKEVLRIKKHFAWFQPWYDIYSNGNKIGKIQERFIPATLAFDITNSEGKKFIIRAVMPRLNWRYDIKGREGTVATVRKKWAGTGKEIFTLADKFHVDFGMAKTEDMRKLILAVALAIDTTAFEKK